MQAFGFSTRLVRRSGLLVLRRTGISPLHTKHALVASGRLGHWSRSDRLFSSVTPEPARFVDPDAVDPAAHLRDTVSSLASTNEDQANYSLADLTSETQAALKKRGVEELFPIQAATLPHTTQGKDVMGRAFTGTGKTLAYLLPLVESGIMEGRAGKQRRNPLSLVLVPTRELALQVLDDCRKFLPGVGAVAVYGGAPYAAQIDALDRGVDIVVGTPGRLLDLVSQGACNLNETKIVALDEADTMLSRGFQAEIEDVLNACPRPGERQTLLFSATFPDHILRLARKLMHEPVTVDLIGDNRGTADTLRHLAISVPSAGQANLERSVGDLLHVHGRGERTIVFVERKADAQRLVDSPQLKKFGASALHGDMTQAMREVTMSNFRRNQFQVLVATDVAARGLDVPEVDLVIQLSVPRYDNREMYVHRAGRAGRAGREGKSFLIHTPADERALRELEKFTGAQFERTSLPLASEVMAGAAHSAVERLASMAPRTVDFFTPFAEEVLASDNAVETVAAALAELTGFQKLAQERSLLSGSGMHTAVLLQSGLVQGLPAFNKLLSQCCRGVNLGRIVGCAGELTGAVVVDVPTRELDAVKELLERADADISTSVPKTLPPTNWRQMFEKAGVLERNNRQRNNHRGGRSNQQRGGGARFGGRGGRGGDRGRGRDRFQGRGRDGGDRRGGRGGRGAGGGRGGRGGRGRNSNFDSKYSF